MQPSQTYIAGFNPHPSGEFTHSTDPLLEAILEQTRKGRKVIFDDDIGPDLGITIEKNTVNLHSKRHAVRKLKISHWINDSDYELRMFKRNDAGNVADLIRRCGAEMDLAVKDSVAEGWLE